MLVLDPEKRISAVDSLQDPWFKDKIAVSQVSPEE
jgi:hypothetical protein